MNAINFTYKKANGSTSERNLLVTQAPSDKFAGIDMSEMTDPVQMAEFIKLATQLHDVYVMKLNEIQAAFDLKHSYRQFFEAQMSNVTKI